MGDFVPAPDLKLEEPMIDKDSKVWECIACGYKYVGKDKVVVCPYCQRKNTFVYHKNLVVTK